MQYKCACSALGKDYGEAVYHLAYINIMTTIVSHFFCRTKGVIQDNPGNFAKYIMSVAMNTFRAELDNRSPKKKESKDSRKLREVPTEPDIIATCQADDADNSGYEIAKERLAEAFAYVLSPESGASVHIILTWLAVSIYMLDDCCTRIESSHHLIDEFSKKHWVIFLYT